MGTFSLVFGILGVMGTIPLAILAIILGAFGKKHHQQYARGCFTLGIIGVAMVVWVLLVFLALAI